MYSMFTSSAGGVSKNYFGCDRLDHETNVGVSVRKCAARGEVLGVLTRSDSVSVCVVGNSRVGALLSGGVFRPVSSSVITRCISGAFSSIRRVYASSSNGVVVVPLSRTIVPLLIPGGTIRRLSLGPRRVRCCSSFLSCLEDCSNRHLSCNIRCFLFGYIRDRCRCCRYSLPGNMFSCSGRDFEGLCRSALKDCIASRGKCCIPSRSLPVKESAFSISGGLFSVVRVICFVGHGSPRLATGEFSRFILCPVPGCSRGVANDITANTRFTCVGPCSGGGRSTLGLLRAVSRGCFSVLGAGVVCAIFSSLDVCPRRVSAGTRLFESCVRVTRGDRVLLCSRSFDIAIVGSSCGGGHVALSRTVTRHAQIIGVVLGR